MLKQNKRNDSNRPNKAKGGNITPFLSHRLHMQYRMNGFYPIQQLVQFAQNSPRSDWKIRYAMSKKCSSVSTPLSEYIQGGW